VICSDHLNPNEGASVGFNENRAAFADERRNAV
jgi:hypothetical protein